MNKKMIDLKQLSLTTEEFIKSTENLKNVMLKFGKLTTKHLNKNKYHA